MFSFKYVSFKYVSCHQPESFMTSEVYEISSFSKPWEMLSISKRFPDLVGEMSPLNAVETLHPACGNNYRG